MHTTQSRGSSLGLPARCCLQRMRSPLACHPCLDPTSCSRQSCGVSIPWRLPRSNAAGMSEAGARPGFTLAPGMGMSRVVRVSARPFDNRVRAPAPAPFRRCTDVTPGAPLCCRRDESGTRASNPRVAPHRRGQHDGPCQGAHALYIGSGPRLMATLPLLDTSTSPRGSIKPTN